jgi:group II intron maturase
MVHGTRAHAEALREEVAEVLAPLGLRLAKAKTRIVHIDEGLDFLGFRIQRQPKRGSGKPTVYTYPSKTALARVKATVRTATRQGCNQPLAVLLYRLAPVVRGWVNYFRHGVSKATFDYLRHVTWRRVICWLRHKHRHATWKWLRRRYLPGWWPADGQVSIRPDDHPGHPLPVSGQHPLALASSGLNPTGTGTWRAGCVGTRTSGSASGLGKRARRNPGTAPQADSTGNG